MGDEGGEDEEEGIDAVDGDVARLEELPSGQEVRQTSQGTARRGSDKLCVEQHQERERRCEAHIGEGAGEDARRTLHA